MSILVHINALRGREQLPHIEAHSLWTALRAGWSGVMLLAPGGMGDVVDATEWMRRHDLLVPDVVHHDDQLEPLFSRLSGQGLHLYVDTDPETVALALHWGIPTLLYSHPRYARPEWRPDEEVAQPGWAKLMAERA